MTSPEVITTRIDSQRQIAERTFRLRAHAPHLARTCLPGQFAMVRLAGRSDPLLGRPLAVYDVDPQTESVEFVYVVHGRFTQALAACDEGTSLGIVGPLGNGFAASPAKHLVLVAGGIGQTALLALGREHTGHSSYGGRTVARPENSRVTLFWGARAAAAFGDVDRFTSAGIDVRLATLDGSSGFHGTVLDLLAHSFAGDDVAQSSRGGRSPAGAPPSVMVACCGPEGMMSAVANWADSMDIPCHVSLETPMACGIGICFSCVAAVRDDAGGWDWRRTCIEGPVFDARAIEWNPDTAPASTSDCSMRH